MSEQETQRRGSYVGDMTEAEVRAFEAQLDGAANSDELLDLQPYLSETARAALAHFDVNLARVVFVSRDGRRIGPEPLAHIDVDELVQLTGGGIVKATAFQEGQVPAYFKLRLPDPLTRVEQRTGAQLSPETVALQQQLATLTGQVTALTQLVGERKQGEESELMALAKAALADQLEAGRTRRERDLQREPEKPKSGLDLLRERREEIELLKEIAAAELPAGADSDAEVALLNRAADVGDKLVDAWIASRGRAGTAPASRQLANDGELTAADKAILKAAGGDAA